MKHTLLVLPDQKRDSFPSHTPLRRIFEELHIDIWYPCAGFGSCGKCRVRFRKGSPEPTRQERLVLRREELEQGIRLACQSSINGEAIIEIPEASRLRSLVAMTDSIRIQEKLDPAIRKVSVSSPEATLTYPLSLEEQILTALDEKARFTLGALKQAGTMSLSRKSKDGICVTLYDDLIIHVEADRQQKKMYGLAIDLGTTTLAIALIDLHNGATLGIEADTNPQSQMGDDLISRVALITQDINQLSVLRRKVVAALNRLVHRLLKKNNINPKHVYSAVLAGNTVMNHIFAGVDPSSIAQIPFAPVFKKMQKFNASSLMLKMNPEAMVSLLPNIGGFVGGDTIADLLVANSDSDESARRLLLDIGTNCEVVLQYGGRILAASAPAGPALEGMTIECGMRAEAGAIADVDFTDGILQLQTIDDQPARGLCGSGLIHIIDAFVQSAIIATDGRIADPETIPDTAVREFLKKRLAYKEDGSLRIYLLEKRSGHDSGIYLSQKDIRQFQLARAAIATTWLLLCEIAGCSPDNLGEVQIAGGFGNYIRPDALRNLGIIPNLPAVRSLGNAALEGARMALFNKKTLQKAGRMFSKIRFKELAAQENFQQVYVEQLQLTKQTLKI